MKKYAADSMSKDLITLPIDASLREAHAVMEERKIRHLPIQDPHGKVVGILSSHDLERALNPSRPGFSANQKAADFMSWPAVTVDEKTPLADVAERMMERKVSAFLVTGADAEVLGIITSEDLLQLLRSLLQTEKGLSLRSLPYTPVVREAMHEIASVGL